MKIVGKTHAKFVSTVSAWSELIGYVASIWLCVIKQRESLEREIELLQAAQRQRLVRRAPFRGFCWNLLWLCGCLVIVGGHAKCLSAGELLNNAAHFLLKSVFQSNYHQQEGKWDAEADKRLEKDLALMYKARRFRTIGMLQDLSGQSRSKG